MTVAELIEELRKYPGDMFALISDGRDMRHMISHVESEFGPLIVPRIKFAKEEKE